MNVYQCPIIFRGQLLSMVNCYHHDHKSLRRNWVLVSLKSNLYTAQFERMKNGNHLNVHPKGHVFFFKINR